MTELTLYVIGTLVLLVFNAIGWTLDVRYEVEQPWLYFVLGMVGAIIAMSCVIPFLTM